MCVYGGGGGRGMGRGGMSDVTKPGFTTMFVVALHPSNI